MTLYRIARQKYIGDLSGNGGLISSARWHDHIPVIYTSLTSSTCILEKLVHLVPEEIHHDLMIATIQVPENTFSEVVEAGQLPVEWNSFPAPGILKRLGNAWLRGMSAPLLFVPSVIDPLTQNVLINPLHPEARGIRVESTVEFSFDQRLWRG